MPTPASRAIARIDSSASAEANTRVATASSWPRLRAASARGARISAPVETERAPLVLRSSMQTEHSPFQCVRASTAYAGPRRQRSMQEQSNQTPTGRSRAVQLDAFGGPDVLDVREVPAPQAGPGQVRVRVTAAGLNPMDWLMTADADTAARFGLTLPVGFGTDYAGVVDQVGDGVSGFTSGDRAFGGALSRAVADFVVADSSGDTAANEAHHTPDGVDDRIAA